MSAVCPLPAGNCRKRLICHTRLPFSLGLGGRLPNQQLDVAHVVGPVCQQFHKAKLQEDLQGAFHGADLRPRDSRYHLCRVGNIVVELELAAMLERFQIELQQDVGVQHPVLHTLQEDDGIIVKVVFFQLEVVVFSVVCHK